MLGGSKTGSTGFISSSVLGGQVLQERSRSAMSSLCQEPPALELSSLDPSGGSGRKEKTLFGIWVRKWKARWGEGERLSRAPSAAEGHGVSVRQT